MKISIQFVPIMKHIINSLSKSIDTQQKLWQGWTDIFHHQQNQWVNAKEPYGTLPDLNFIQDFKMSQIINYLT